MLFSALTPQARRMLAESATCGRCVDGIQRTKHAGSCAVICPCAWETFQKAFVYTWEERARRRAGLPPRLAKLENGVFEAPTEVGLDLADAEFTVAKNQA